MNVTHISLANLPLSAAGHALLIGTFDGFHIGHQSLLHEARKSSANVSVLLIYSNKVRTKEHQKSGHLSNIDDRLVLFQKFSIANVFLLNLGQDLLSLTKEQFITLVLNKLAVKSVVIGEDFRFGANARGTPLFLQETNLKNFAVHVVKPLMHHEAKISTALIKDYLLKGEPEVATKLLSHPYTVTGLVVKGFGLGEKLGFPTANVALDPLLFLPRHGVYLVGVCYKAQNYFGMASLGFHPTVNEVKAPLLEVNLFDFKANLYHEVIKVRFLAFLRDEVKLNSLDELKQKIAQDKRKCVTLLKEMRYEDECL